MQTKQEFAGVSELDSKQAMITIVKTVPALLAVSAAVGAPPLAALITASVGGIIMSFGAILFDNWRTRRTSIHWPLLAVSAAAIATFGYAHALTIFLLAGAMMALIGLTPIGYWIGKTVSPVVLAGVLAALSLTTIVNMIPLWLGLGVSAEPIWTTLWRVIMSIERIDAASLMIGVAGLFMIGLFRALQQGTKPTDNIRQFPILAVVLVLTSVLAWLFGTAQASAWQLVFLDMEALAHPGVWNYAAIIAVIATAQIWKNRPEKGLDMVNTSTMLGLSSIVTSLLGGWAVMAKVDPEPTNAERKQEQIIADFAVYAIAGMLFVVLMLLPFGLIGMTGAAIVTMAILYHYTRISLYQNMWRRGAQTIVVFAIAFVLSLVTEWVLIAILLAELVDAFWSYRELLRPQYALKISHHSSGTTHNIYITAGDVFDEGQSIASVMEAIPTQEPVTIQVLPMARQEIAKHAHLSPRVRILLRGIIDQHPGPVMIQDADGQPILSDGIQDEYPIIPHKTQDGWEYRPISTQ